jgi:hypothetical protein
LLKFEIEEARWPGAFFGHRFYLHHYSLKNMKKSAFRYLLFFSLFWIGFLVACEQEAIMDVRSTESTEGIPVPQASLVPSLPASWTSVQTGNGVVLGKRTYIRSGVSYTDYVQLVDLSAGASIQLRQGSGNLASNVNPSPTFTRRSLSFANSSSWYWATYATTNTFSMTNLQFFNFSNGSLAFPLKANGTIITCGYGNNEPLSKRKLGINGTAIVVADYLNTSNDYNTVSSNLVSPLVIVGLNPDVPKNPTSLTGRTYIGYKNSTLVIYASRAAQQAQVKTIMMGEFGINASNMLMFDGSGSTQLMCKGIKYITSPDSRPIPSVIEVLQ